jgi:peptidoglycan/LPS O-acetylase OafA/YrhL
MKPQSTGHIPALDGIRGIAILLVILRHASAGDVPTGTVAGVIHAVMRAGWIGVDVFFVLSGFLITGILLDSKGYPGYLTSFFGRRVLRIFPLYFGFLAVLFLVFPFTALATSPEYVTLRHYQAWYWLYASNVLIALHGDGASGLHLGHTWSLAVEEQFYLLWPLVVMLAPRRRIGAICLALAGVAGVLRVALVFALGWGSDWGYMMMPARMDALLLGGALAFALREPALRRRIPSLRPGMVALAAALLVTLLFAVRPAGASNDPYVQVLGYPLLALGATGLLAFTILAPADSRLVGALSHPLLRTFGKYSYAVYLLHFPLLLVILRWLPPSALPLVAGHPLAELLVLVVETAGVGLAAAMVSWRLLEQPFLSLKRYVPRPA